jgi:hypothetical protein
VALVLLAVALTAASWASSPRGRAVKTFHRQTSATLAPGASTVLGVSCGRGKLLSGGYAASGPISVTQSSAGDLTGVETHPPTAPLPNSWRVAATNPATAAVTLTAEAVCAG